MSAKAILGVMLTVIAAGLAGGGVYALHRLKMKKIDPATLCPLEGSRVASVILIDNTDPLTAAEKTRARGFVAEEAAAVRKGDRITVRLLRQMDGAAGIALATDVDLCNPGAEANPLFENPKRVAARYRSAFREPLDEVLADGPETGPAAASPIAQAIHESLAAVPEAPAQHLRLTLVSDLMEHTPGGASAYAGTLSEAALHKEFPPALAERLRGAEVRILLLNRARYAKQQAAAIAVWRRLFQTVTRREPELVPQ
jgi:hypothetical protein